MSDMPAPLKTKSVRRRKAVRSVFAGSFTVRDLSRKTAAVMASCERLGSVDIATRDGRAFVLSVKPTRDDGIELPDWEARRNRMKQLGMVPLNQNSLGNVDLATNIIPTLKPATTHAILAPLREWMRTS